MGTEPSVTVRLNPCPDCGGRGSMPPEVSTSGMSRSISSGGNCERCQGQGKIEREVSLSELRRLMDNYNPDDFRA